MPLSPALARRLALYAFDAFIRFVAATFLAIASFALVMSWHSGPQRMIYAHGAQKFTGHKDARIVESWVAVAFDPGAMGTSKHWRGFAKSSACVIVEYDGEWGSVQRGFCGPRYGFIEKTTLHDLREMSPGVPFDYARDANGFSVPELRMNAAGLAYLKAQPATRASGGTLSALDEMRHLLDRPVDAAILSWSNPPPAFPLAFDPEHPAETWPAGHIESRRAVEPIWLPAIPATVIGLVFWFLGMHLLFMGLPAAARWVLAALPLLAVPWWAQELPHALRHIHGDIAATVAETLGDITASGSMEAFDAPQTRLRDGARVSFGVGDGVYRETMGRLRFSPPAPPPATADAALAALVASATQQVRAMGGPERAALFERLWRDKKDQLPYAGLVFLRSAKEALLDPRGRADVQSAARGFLGEWVTSPVLKPVPEEPAFEQRLALLRSLTDIPVTVIAYPASLAVEDTEASARRKK